MSEPAHVIVNQKHALKSLVFLTSQTTL